MSNINYYKNNTEDLVLKETGFNKLQLKFADFFLDYLGNQYPSNIIPDYIHLPFNESVEEKIDKKDVSYVIEKLFDDYQFLESNQFGYKLNFRGKEMLQKYSNFSSFITEQIEERIEQAEEEIEKNSKQKIIDELNLRQLKRLTRQAKWWWAIMLLNMILSVAAAYLLFRLGVH